jgi:hypothetical protein
MGKSFTYFLYIAGILCCRRMEKITWKDSVRNEEVLHRVKEENDILYAVIRRKAN